ncbi:MAG: cation diffusion facilitator family transporter [Candidatus Eisenbacteria bacterium]|nr:cation diffusion facilitator family transporter [Candidatus Eisenbacteria bacterium]
MKVLQTRRGAAGLSVLSNLTLTSAKLVAASLTGSVGLLSEAVHSGVDLLASGIAFVAVRKAEAPADARYRYGHGKWESLSGLLEGILILLAAGLIWKEALYKWVHPEPLRSLGSGLAAIVLSIVVNTFVSRHLFRVARRERSLALEVDAAHLKGDVISSIGVLAGLVLVYFTRDPRLDAAAGFVVGGFVVHAGWGAMQASVEELLDRSLPQEEAMVRRILDDHMPQFLSYHDLRSRRVGRRSLFEIHLVVTGDQTVEQAHAFCDHLEHDIREALGDVHVAIHVEPPSELEPSERDRLRRSRPPERLSPREILARELPGRLPGRVLEVLRALQERGRQGYVVGGVLRDVLLGRGAPDDWDVATDAPPDEVLALFPDALQVGIVHGTVGVRDGERLIEVTTFRHEWGYSDARHPDGVKFVSSIEDDLARRDFTVNAMAYDPLQSRFVDPEGGWADLQAKLLRAVGDPAERFREDGLRPLRAARFAAQLDFALDEATLEAIGPARPSVARVAVERVRDELKKLVVAERARRGFAVLERSGLLEDVLPELAACRDVYQNRFHAFDVYGHSLATLENAPRAKARVRWAALLHDIGKPGTKQLRDGEGTFHNHQAEGAEMADALLRRLRFGNAERETIVHLVREHMFDYRAEWTDAALRRFVRRVGRENLADLFDLRIADMLGNGLKQGFPHYLEELHARIEALLERDTALSPHDLALDGAEIMRLLGIGPGPRVGAAQEFLLEAVLEEPSRNTAIELERVLRENAEKLRQA